VTPAGRNARVIRAVRATLTGDASDVSMLFTEDVVAWSPFVVATSREELAVELEDREEPLSDLELTATPLETTGNCACLEWVAAATHSGPVLVEGMRCLEPTGRRVTLRGVTVAEFAGERIRALRHYWDGIALLSQLGSARAG
jgi:ketosteroid isomerase-like protein